MNNPFGAEIKASQKEYDKSTKELVKQYGGSFFHRLLGAGLITKEEIVKMDADMENEALDKVKANPDDATAKEYLNKLQNSNLIMDTFLNETGSLFDTPRKYSDIRTKLEGSINGKNTFILKSEITKDNESYSGHVDDNKLNQEEAKSIFENYFPIAKERTLKIQEIVKENDFKMEREVMGETFTEQDLQNADAEYVSATNELNNVDVTSQDYNEESDKKLFKRYSEARKNYIKIHKSIHPEMYTGGNKGTTYLPDIG